MAPGRLLALMSGLFLSTNDAKRTKSGGFVLFASFVFFVVEKSAGRETQAGNPFAITSW
jgi:hypothetical protein